MSTPELPNTPSRRFGPWWILSTVFIVLVIVAGTALVLIQRADSKVPPPVAQTRTLDIPSIPTTGATGGGSTTSTSGGKSPRDSADPTTCGPRIDRLDPYMALEPNEVLALSTQWTPAPNGIMVPTLKQNPARITPAGLAMCYSPDMSGATLAAANIFLRSYGPTGKAVRERQIRDLLPETDDTLNSKFRDVVLLGIVYPDEAIRDNKVHIGLSLDLTVVAAGERYHLVLNIYMEWTGYDWVIASLREPILSPDSKYIIWKASK